MQHPGWILVGLGVVLAILGILWILAPAIPWLGRLPGDIAYERGNVRVYFPLMTSILISLLLTAIFWIVRTLSR